MNAILAALFPVSTASSPTGQNSPSSAPSKGGFFKQSLASALLPSTSSTQAELESATSTSASNLSNVAVSNDTPNNELEKKITEQLNAGTSLTDIINALAASLAQQIANAAHSSSTQAQAQSPPLAALQSAFAAALSPPGTAPPATIAEQASALAQRFRHVADVATRVSDEMGQANRLFAGSNLDAAATAGVQPTSPSSGVSGPPSGSISTALVESSGSSNALARSTATAGLALAQLPSDHSPSLRSLGVAPSLPGDGRTVAFANVAPALGTNGATPLGRILARATLSQSLPATVATNGKASENSASPTTSATTSPTGTTMALAQAQPALTPSGLNTFLQSFAQALSRADATGSPQGALARSDGSDEPLLTTSVTSAQAPQVGAFLPVQAPFSIDASSTNAPQSATPPTSSATVDPNAVVDQILKGAFLRTDGSSSSVRLNLIPESLGSVTVNLHVDGSSVNATVVAQTPDARDALLAGQNQLVRSLADAGMKLASFTVNLAGGGFSGFQQQQHHSLAQESSAGRNARGNVGDATDVGDAVVAAIPTFGPPLVASSNAGLYNYLA